MSTSRLLDLKKLKFEVRDAMRYDDAGDYFDNTIVAYDFKNDVITNAIFLHEFIEYMLIKASGIEPDLIDRFDTDDTSKKEFPKEFALYGKFHEMANQVERQFIQNLGLSWDEHDKTINTTKVKIAVQKLSDTVHGEKPQKAAIARVKRIVTSVFKKQK